MLVQPFAKLVAIIISIGVTMIFKDADGVTNFGAVRWLSLVTAVVLIG